ncbi:phenylalanine--tRNA ligase subunit beta [Athalassotoga saccharophila]|uniref:phenylalanine--tRNA ligase subunit beta n=1 Tax=Athalassotoga saccharophila TaxID=1441386 RepID=UPI001379B9DA|nr:phenylalanine--tRNA ligase subunit beta [Athalassotoga saccharophila]BBJ27974.1 phenylalanine--tRNA ligase beta subunit [Athalassotoga saccharophila]
MKISIEWLNDYIDTGKDIERLAEDLTLSGSEVEEIERPFERINAVFSAKVVERKAHPNADNLIVCRVDDGNGLHTIITSDKTVSEGDFIAFGSCQKASDVNGHVVEPLEIRGVKTDGMAFSLQELGLEAHSEGIFKFEKPVEVGVDIKKLLDLEQTVFELEITPNRPDCLSHIGIARELSAVRRTKFKIPKPSVDFQQGDFPVLIETDKCLRYVALTIKGVTVKDSPLWLKRRLSSVGLRSINNVTDITNYVMMEFGHPVHAFDLEKVNSRIVVKDAKGGEKFVALNSKEYTLNGGETLITDGENILALGGVMGGKYSGISLQTKDILIEIATFDPVNTRKTSRKINLSTDASYRFERGVDPNDTFDVAKRIAQMVISISGGKIDGIVDVYPTEVKSKKVFISREKLSSYMSFTPNENEVEEIFDYLGIKVSQNGNGWECIVPTFRPDINQDVDLVEEFARIHGLDAIPSVMSMPFVKGESNSWWEFKNKLRTLSTSCGYFENVNYSFSDPKVEELFGDTFKRGPKLLNPVSPEMSLMRSSLIFNLIDSLSYNVKHQENNVKFFEIGKAFEEKEEERISFAATGAVSTFDYTDKRYEDLLIFKGEIESIFKNMHIDFEFSNEDMAGFENGRCGRILLNGKKIGIIGQISEKVNEFFDVDTPIYVAELKIEEIFKNLRPFRYESYSQYPSSFKDLSMFVKKGEIRAAEIFKTARNSSEYVQDVRVVDLYTGKGVPQDSYSITIRVTYNSVKKTLSDQEIDSAFSRLMELLESMKGITLRKVR